MIENLEQLEQELSIAVKYNLPQREIKHLKNLIEIEKAKIANRKSLGTFRKNLLQSIFKGLI